MTVYKTTTWLAASLLIAAQAVTASAQIASQIAMLQDDPFCGDCCEHDLQFFSPVDFDFECLPMRKDCGWHFSYEKLSWAITGERTEIGDPNQVVLSEQIFSPNNPFTEGTPPPQYRINNSIKDAPPEADFGWGERYEFGRMDDGSGWSIGILDGPEVSVARIYGFQHQLLPGDLNTTLIQAFDDLGFTLTGIGNIDVLPGFATADLTTVPTGFGSVHVNFDTPDGFLLGFRDYVLGTNGPTTAGPGIQVVAVTMETDAVTGITTITDITISEDGDGLIVDDLDGDLLSGAFFVLADLDGDGTPEVIGEGLDLDDLHTFNIAFNTFHVRNTTETQGVELMETVRLGNRHHMTKHQNNEVSIGYGVRFLQINDTFYWEGRGSIFGRTLAETEAQNSIFGPQIRGTWTNRRGRMTTKIDGRCLFGYNVQDLDQIGLFGETARPGGINESAVAQPNAIAHGRTENDFSPVVEFRAETSYAITSSISAKLGYTAIFVDNITRSSQVMNWSLPDFGILEGGQQDIFINGATFGFDVVY